MHAIININHFHNKNSSLEISDIRNVPDISPLPDVKAFFQPSLKQPAGFLPLQPLPVAAHILHPYFGFCPFSISA